MIPITFRWVGSHAYWQGIVHWGWIALPWVVQDSIVSYLHVEVYDHFWMIFSLYYWFWTSPISMTMWNFWTRLNQAKIKVSIDLWNQSLSLLRVGLWNLKYWLSYCSSIYWNKFLRWVYSYDKFGFLSWQDGTVCTDEYLDLRHETFWKCCT